MQNFTDPGEQFEQLVIVVTQPNLAKCLLQVDMIKMPVGKLVVAVLRSFEKNG